MYGKLTRFAWSDGPYLAWGLVHLSQGSAAEAVKPYVYRGLPAALEGEKRAGKKLYRVTREILSADENTEAPESGPYAFVCSSVEDYTVWSKPTITAGGGSEYDGVWSFPDARGAMERTGWANREHARYVGPDNPRFGTFLLTWDVTEEKIAC